MGFLSWGFVFVLGFWVGFDFGVLVFGFGYGIWVLGFDFGFWV